MILPSEIVARADIQPGRYRLAVIIDMVERTDPAFQGIYRRRALVGERRRTSSQIEVKIKYAQEE
jgi:hypothetical protein